MARSKTIKLFLMDGEATGRIKCSLANWTGVAYKIPKTMLDQCRDIEYLKQSGVYFLFGTDEQYDQIVYIGQAGIRKNGKGLLLRVQEPHPSIDWTEAVMFTTTNNSFGPTEISYLENRFCNMALEAGRYQVRNGKINDRYELTSDILMTSPSAAAGFVSGASLDGMKQWHDSDGQSLKQMEE